MTKTSQNHVFERDCFKKSGSFGIFYYSLCFSLRVFRQVLKKMVYIVLLHLISEVSVRDVFLSVRDAQFLGHSSFIYQ